jgi:hypothetical protein
MRSVLQTTAPGYPVHTVSRRARALVGDPAAILVLAVFVIEASLNFARSSPDSAAYLNYSLFFLGERSATFTNPPDVPYSVADPANQATLRPMLSLLAAVLSPVVGLSSAYGLINAAFWLGGALIAYKLTGLVSRNHDLQLAASILYITSRPNLIYGTSILADEAGYFFVGLLVYLTLRQERRQERRTTYFLEGLLCGVAVLFRETAIPAVGFMAFRSLVRRRGTLELLAGGAIVALLMDVFLRTAVGYDAGLFSWVYTRYLGDACRSCLFTGGVGRSWVNPGNLVPNPIASAVPFLNYAPLRVFWRYVMFFVLAFFPYVFFAVVGVFRLRGSAWKVLFLETAIFLFPASFLFTVFDERYTFSLWPAILPISMMGINSPFRPMGKRRRATLYALALLSGLINTLWVISRIGTIWGF